MIQYNFNEKNITNSLKYLKNLEKLAKEGNKEELDKIFYNIEELEEDSFERIEEGQIINGDMTHFLNKIAEFNNDAYVHYSLILYEEALNNTNRLKLKNLDISDVMRKAIINELPHKTFAPAIKNLDSFYVELIPNNDYNLNILNYIYEDLVEKQTIGDTNYVRSIRSLISIFASNFYRLDEVFEFLRKADGSLMTSTIEEHLYKFYDYDDNKIKERLNLVKLPKDILNKYMEDEYMVTDCLVEILQSYFDSGYIDKDALANNNNPFCLLAVADRVPDLKCDINKLYNKEIFKQIQIYSRELNVYYKNCPHMVFQYNSDLIVPNPSYEGELYGPNLIYEKVSSDPNDGLLNHLLYKYKLIKDTNDFAYKSNLTSFIFDNMDILKEDKVKELIENDSVNKAPFILSNSKYSELAIKELESSDNMNEYYELVDNNFLPHLTIKKIEQFLSDPDKYEVPISSPIANFIGATPAMNISLLIESLAEKGYAVNILYDYLINMEFDVISEKDTVYYRLLTTAAQCGYKINNTIKFLDFEDGIDGVNNSAYYEFLFDILKETSACYPYSNIDMYTS